MMNGRYPHIKVATAILPLVALCSCGEPPAAPETVTSAPATPTNPPAVEITSTSAPTSTSTPEPTSLPGEQVYPLASLGGEIPWLPLEEGEEPMTVYLGFNVGLPPFDDPLVRRAFAAAVDREQIAEEAAGFGFREVSPATSLTPSDTLGRNLYGEVGIPFDPGLARDLLAQAGYESTESFPSVLLIVSMRGQAAPGAYYRMAQSIVGMWQTHLGISVELQTAQSMGEYIGRLETDPPEIYQLGWGADYNDPDNFLRTLFHSSSQFNYGHFSNPEFDRLVDAAAAINDPPERQLAYIEAERILTEEEAAVIPLFHTLFYVAP